MTPRVQRYGDWTVQGSGGRVEVTPDLFGGATIPVAVEARRLPSRTFRSDAELRHALSTADSTTLRGEIAAAPG